MIVGGIVYMHKSQITLIKTPPESLAQWYKPTNKRQVWLHNMFKLRREIQATRYYANNNDAAHMEKWAAELGKHYMKIGEMVPEWKKKLDNEIIANLENQVSNHQYQNVLQTLDDLDKNCKSCHVDYRAITAMMYRAPDFSTMKEISPSISWHEHMKELAQQINLIKIGSEDHKPNIALVSLSDLEKGMNALGKTCSNCHKEDKRDYPGEEINKTIDSLRESLISGTQKDQGRQLGTLAVTACAQCHGTHRISSDSRKLFTEPQDWRQLIKH